MSTCCACMDVSCGITSPCKAMKSTATEGKMEMHSLNDRLAAYISKVRNVRTSCHQFDASSYRDQITGLEDEIVKLKDMYNAEICKLRQQAQHSGSQHSSLSSMYETSQLSVTDLMGKLAHEKQHCERISAELSSVRCELMSGKKQISDLKISLDAARSEAKTADCRVTICHYDDLKLRFECEVKTRRDLEESMKCIQDRLSFESRTREQEKSEFHERLATSSDIIRSLESKLKEVTSVTTIDYSRVLEKLREGTMVELRRYQSETEEALNKNISALRCQIESEKSVRCGLNTDKSRLEELVVELRSQLAATEGKIAGLVKQRDALEGSLRSERSRSSNHTVELEAKLAEMNEVMLLKVKECNEAREMQVALKTEIDAFKALLLEGEHRLTDACNVKLVDIDTRIRKLCDCYRHTHHHHHTTHRTYDNTCTTKVPCPPTIPKRRPTSAHSSCHMSRTHTAPVDDRVFHLRGSTEYRSSAGTGACISNVTTRPFALDDLDIRGTTPSFHRRVTLDYPETIGRVSIKDDIEVNGKGISSCYSTPFPKRNYCSGATKCQYVNRTYTSRPKTATYCTY